MFLDVSSMSKETFGMPDASNILTVKSRFQRPAYSFESETMFSTSLDWMVPHSSVVMVSLSPSRLLSNSETSLVSELVWLDPQDDLGMGLYLYFFFRPSSMMSFTSSISLSIWAFSTSSRQSFRDMARFRFALDCSQAERRSDTCPNSILKYFQLIRAVRIFVALQNCVMDEIICSSLAVNFCVISCRFISCCSGLHFESSEEPMFSSLTGDMAFN
mmetsp:Transcript_1070/g.1911  ORF Transcript_1070/g.1911 Transcript_1070/m.1911 type:complete len:216 (-) Transcript_1070:2517-3164(-)